MVNLSFVGKSNHCVSTANSDSPLLEAGGRELQDHEPRLLPDPNHNVLSCLSCYGLGGPLRAAALLWEDLLCSRRRQKPFIESHAHFFFFSTYARPKVARRCLQTPLPAMGAKVMKTVCYNCSRLVMYIHIVILLDSIQFACVGRSGAV